ncbi:hypothetical protein C5167_022302 [Papaver somniferum]|uniref:Uncharacterized protein n=1 Tax=Papaver somniferum TaxID=3469 RepID=A0A4Y7JJ22_PAPSO|nr:hypothetical protein C5167_022302 [Papaver somniferum]
MKDFYVPNQGWWYSGNFPYGMGRYAQFSLADGGLMCDVVHYGALCSWETQMDLEFKLPHDLARDNQRLNWSCDR